MLRKAVKSNSKNNKQAVSSSDPFKNMQHPHPWRSIGVGLFIVFAILATLSVIGGAWDRYEKNRKLADIHNVMIDVAKQVELLSGRKTELKDYCATQEFGFARSTDCGTSAKLSFPYSMGVVEQQNSIKKSFEQAGLTVLLTPGKTEDQRYGYIKFSVKDYDCGGGYMPSQDSLDIEYVYSCTIPVPEKIDRQSNT